MEITGCDLVIFTFELPRVVFTRVLAAVLARWPEALVTNLDEGAAAVSVAGREVLKDHLPHGDGVLHFVRDMAMARHMKDHAYISMRDGDGPFAIHARTRRGVEFECDRLNELQVTDEPPSQIAGAPDPYPAWICSPLLYEITAVTPGDPDTQPFSRWVLGMVRRACTGLTEAGRSSGI